MEIVKDIWGFLKVRKKFWLLPLILIMITISAIIIFSGGSAVAPFIYTIF